MFAHRIVVLSIIAAGILTFAAMAANAQDGPCSEEPGVRVACGDRPVDIMAFTGENNFIGNFRIRAIGADEVARFETSILPGDLQSETDIIRRDQISLSPAGPAVEVGRPQNVMITVSGVTEPGTYRGALEIIARDPGARLPPVSETVEIELVADLRSLVTPVSSSVALQFTDVDGVGNGIFAYVFGVPENERANQVTIAFSNPTGRQPEVRSAGVALATANGIALPDSAVRVSTAEFERADSQRLPLLLEFERSRIPAGTYTGSLALDLRRGSGPINVPIELKVRDGLLWPTLFVFFGLLIGRLAKFIRDSGGRLADQVIALDRLATRIRDDGILGPGDRSMLLEMIDDLRQDHQNLEPNEFRQRLNAIRIRRDALVRLCRIEARLHELADDADRIKIETEARSAREWFRQRDDDKALAALKRAVDLFVNAPRKVADISELEAMRRWIERTAKRLPSPARPGSLRFFLTVTGINDRPDAATLALWWRPILYFVTLLLLLVIGIKTLYFEQGTTFGSEPLHFLPMLLWGLSTDVASRTLGNIGGS